MRDDLVFTFFVGSRIGKAHIARGGPYQQSHLTNASYAREAAIKRGLLGGAIYR